MNKNLVLYILGAVYLFLGALSIIHGFDAAGLANIFWISYSSLLILGIGFLKKDDFLIAGMLNVITIPFLIWSVDFIYYFITNSPLWGITDYFFEIERTHLAQFITLQHLFTIPIGIFALFLVGLKRKDAWKFSIGYTLFIFLFSFLLSNPGQNINCVYESCFPFSFGFIYQIEWFIGYLVMIFFINFLLVKFLKN